MVVMRSEQAIYRQCTSRLHQSENTSRDISYSVLGRPFYAASQPVLAFIIRKLQPGLVLGMHQANERRRYKVTPSLIGLAQT